MATIDVIAYREHEEQGLITCRSHPQFDLVIWNYTPKCTCARAWDDVTTQARGLITRPDGTVMSRAFRKFFNLGERAIDLPLEPFTVTDKHDGSLGISYLGDDGRYYISTRGSFTSKQAIRASQILHQKYPDFPFQLHPEYTYLFEIVFPENRYVVNYGDMEDLILLAVIHTETGEERDLQDINVPTPIVRIYDGLTDIHALEQLEEDNREGFVVRFASGLRVKVKFAEYKRLFRLLTSCSTVTIWEYLRDGKGTREILDRVPEEFAVWVKSITRDLGTRYTQLFAHLQLTYKQVIAETSIPTPFPIGSTLTVQEVETISKAMQKELEQRFSIYPDDIKHLLFTLHTTRGKNKKVVVSQAIWDTLRPEYSRPFLLEGEDA